MANIRTVITLVDSMSPTLHNINRNLGTTTSMLLAVQAGIAIFNSLRRAILGVANAVNEYTDAYAAQYESEVKLYTIMRQRMNATMEEFNSIKALASELERYGVLSDKVVLKGAQELASFVQTEDQITKMLPAIADLVVQQNGYNASADQMKQVTTSIGKMLNGTVSGLSKLGLAFTDEEKKMLKSNDMAKKVEIVYNRISEKVGNMNQAMGKTNIGKIQQLKNKIESVNEELGRMMQPLRIVGLEIKLAFKTWVLEHFNSILEKVQKFSWVLVPIIGALAFVIGSVLVMALYKFITAFVTMVTVMKASCPILLLIEGVLLAIGALTGMGLGGKMNKYIKEATSGFQEDMPTVPIKDGAVVVHDDELINIAEDYRDLLSKRAVERFNLQLARIAPSITIEKVDVHKEADASNVLDVVVNAIEDFSNSSLSTARGR